MKNIFSNTVVVLMQITGSITNMNTIGLSLLLLLLTKEHIAHYLIMQILAIQKNFSKGEVSAYNLKMSILQGDNGLVCLSF